MTTRAGEIGVRQPGVEYGPVSFAPDDAIDSSTGKLDRVCPGWMTVGECDSGHVFARELVCGREWCSHCGQKNGVSHDRRKGRWYPKGVQIASMVYTVITLPPAIRHRYRTKLALSALGAAFRGMLQEHGYKRGLRGWDWFGEEKNAPEGESPRWHPHFNALVEGAYLDKDKRKSIKRSVARILGIRLVEVNVHYQYSSEVGRKLHWLNYVTRPTFLDWRWDSEMAVELKGFRTYQTWGKWEDEPAWEVPTDSVEAPPRAVFALERGFCPECGGKLTWGTAQGAKFMNVEEWEVVGGGYWGKKGFHT